MTYLVDSHCHLNFPELKGQIPELLAAARENNVQVLQTICTKISEFDEIHQIARDNDNVYCSVGIHPHEVAKESISAEKLVELAKSPLVIGIGETGLDYFYEHSPKDIQKTSFIEHIKAARITNCPLIVHARDADADTMDILEAEYAKAPFPFLIHCFTASQELAQRSLAIGGYISISGIVTFNSAKELRQTIKEIPLERLLVETDAPFLAPVPHRGKSNQPAFTRHTAEFLAELKEIPFEQLAEATTDNFFRLFKKAERPEIR